MSRESPRFQSRVYGCKIEWWDPEPRMHSSHAHPEIEVNLVVSGTIRQFVSGASRSFTGPAAVVFWAGLPHRMVETTPDATHFALVVPVGCVLDWTPALGARLLRGEFLRRDCDVAVERPIFSRWVRELADPERSRIALLEVEAWFRRFGLDVSGVKSPAVPADFGAIERVTSYVATHFEDDLSVTLLASVAGLHPKYLMTLFRRVCGMRLWEYVTRVRISHAQRLLACTDLRVGDVAASCGFGSANQFHAAFLRYSETTPRRYRVASR